jgi:hypothetical protein
MSLNWVTLSYDSFLVCTSRAFTTEKQEVMGLMLGRWVSDGEGAIVEHVIVLPRCARHRHRRRRRHRH